MSFLESVKECPRCGCPKEEVKCLNSGPIIRIRCPRCEWCITEGVDSQPGVDALVETWNSARERYLSVLKALYKAQETAPQPVRVQYGDEAIIGIVTRVDCRDDIFDMEMPGTFTYERLDIWKVYKVENYC